MRMNLKILPVLILGVQTVLFSTPARGDGLSREQGDAILSELRQIRQLLEKQPKAVAPPAAPAPPKQIKLKIGKEFAMGSSSAPVVIVEYTDYQCPFCNRFQNTTFPELKKRYIDTGKVRFIGRDYPLDFHPHSLKAAQATRCAGEQDKFWQIKDALMRNSAHLTPDLITSLARDASLDMGKFQACMDGGTYLTDIRDGIATANAVGISGTPSFVIGKMSGDFLDGYLVVGAQPFATFDGLIKQMEPGTRQ
jgi:protein-disulfide isomerase